MVNDGVKAELLGDTKMLVWEQSETREQGLAQPWDRTPPPHFIKVTPDQACNSNIGIKEACTICHSLLSAAKLGSLHVNKCYESATVISPN
jgi:hypothetical protein